MNELRGLNLLTTFNSFTYLILVSNHHRYVLHNELQIHAFLGTCKNWNSRVRTAANN